MKKVLSFLFISTLFLLCSCSDDTPKLDDRISSTSTIGQYDDKELHLVFNLLDSLNSTFVSQSCIGHSSRGFWGKAGRIFVSKLADQAGKKCGTYAGRWAGAAVGSLGGPGTACVGYLAGSYLGGTIGYIVVSAAAEAAYDCAGLAMIAPGHMYLRFNTNINLSCCVFTLDTLSHYSRTYTNDIYKPIEDVIISKPTLNMASYLTYDSIGFIHNSIMCSINKNQEDYRSINGEPNVAELYDDVVVCLKNCGYDVEIFEMDATLRDSMIECAKWFGLLAYNGYYKEGMSIDEYIDAQCAYMKNKCLLTDDEISLYRNFDVKIVEKCNELSLDEIDRYADELNSLIIATDVSPELRVEMALAAQAAINSALCWNQGMD